MSLDDGIKYPPASYYMFYSELECTGEPCLNNCGDVIKDATSCAEVIANDPTVGEVGELFCAGIILTDETSGNETFTRRCVCPLTWNLDGPNCDIVPSNGKGGYDLANITFTLLFFFSLFIGVNSAWYAYMGYRSTPLPVKGRKTKWNASNIAALLLTTGSLSESFRWLLYVIRNNKWIFKDEASCTMSLMECFLSVGVAWLDIAENAEKMGSGDKKFKWQRHSLKAGGVLIFLLFFLLIIIGKADAIPLLVLLAQFIAIVALSVGGYKLRRILKSGGNDSKLPWYIKLTNIGMVISYFLNIIGGVGYTLFNVEKNNTGLRGSLSVGTVGMMSILGVGINGLSFSLYWFIAGTTLKKIRKWQGKQVAVAPVQDETVVSSVSQARRNSNFNSSSSPSTMARSSVE
ncbi:hypothetical protein TrVE_jg10902 [Triparma verrucosa]|uniref:Uncharacterized protein n=1 Tax=Triparma verrucosa TaxID=1606542 RepID=A0A9W7FKS9_9STRA|nr:hypothetical protein TrVE_jg10902 [Triparma verrucosa]